jgi:hypothetical protein
VRERGVGERRLEGAKMTATADRISVFFFFQCLYLWLFSECATFYKLEVRVIMICILVYKNYGTRLIYINQNVPSMRFVQI